MNKKHRKRKREQRQRAALANPQPAPVTIDGPDCDPQTIWREHVNDYAAGYIEEDGRGWKHHGYL